jgi:hypothetical protein
VAFESFFNASFVPGAMAVAQTALPALSAGTADGAQLSWTVIGQTFAMHINPLAAFNFVTALVCVPVDNDGIDP